MNCHPERSRERSGASCPTQSKDPCCPTALSDDEGSFSIVVRFFDDNESEQFPMASREAAACNSPASKCRVGTVDGASPGGTAQLRATNV